MIPEGVTMKERVATRLAVSLDKVAWRLSVSVSFLRLEIGRGRLQAIRLGRRLLISEAEIDRYMKANIQRRAERADAQEKSAR